MQMEYTRPVAAREGARLLIPAEIAGALITKDGVFTALGLGVAALTTTGAALNGWATGTPAGVVGAFITHAVESSHSCVEPHVA
jgi:hypothetical protein